VYAPSTVTTAETFIWYNATPDLRLGVAHLWKQNAFRFLGSYRFVKETATTPALYASVGVQGIGTGNPGYSVTAEKNFEVPEGHFNIFAGIGLRSNESHGHPVGGVKFSFRNGFSVGIQADGHQEHPFVTYSKEHLILGFYLIDGKNPAYLIGARF
jgi:hypothetical protein